jgi:thiamine biosynthesis protein ThiS
VKTLPSVFAVTTDAICRGPDFPAKLATLMEIGPTLGVIIRAPSATAADYVRLAQLGWAARRPLGSAILVHGRPDVAAAIDAEGLILRQSDLAPVDARLLFSAGWIGVSVHSRAEAETALKNGADFVIAGTVFESESHPGRPGHGLEWLRGFADLGAPIIAIGGIGPARVSGVREAGASGVAVISAIWDQPDPQAAARTMIEAWENMATIQLTVNGEPRQVGGARTLEQLLEDLELDARAVVVELNRKIVRRPELGNIQLQNGDAVELVHFVGGG